jgi:plasmid stabilization system protein ParE
MIVRLSFLAEADLDEAADYYESFQEGLGSKFMGRYRAAEARIVAHPRSCASYFYRTRVCKIHRFPFGIVYRLRRREIYVIAIVDLRRRPGYWKRRIR